MNGEETYENQAWLTNWLRLKAKQEEKDFNNLAEVKEKITNIHFTQMGLTHGLHGGMSSDDVFNAWDSATLKTDIQSNGDFSFSGMAQGDYDLFWSGTEDLGSVIYQKVEFIYSPTTSQPTYVAHVGPLCPVDMGKVSNSTLSFSY